MAKVKIDVYMHSTKEEMLGIGEEHGLTDPALKEFMYALYEVKIPILVDTETGLYEILKDEISE